jgi:hypothetical protein
MVKTIRAVSVTLHSLHLMLLVDPRHGGGSPLNEALREPKSDLLVGGLDGVRTVADVSTDVDAEVTSDSARGGLAGLGGAEELAALNRGVITLPDHSEDRGRLHELNQATEERLFLEVSIVSLEVSLRRLDELHGDEFETLLLESGDDGTAEVSLDTVGLHHDEGSILVSGHLRLLL